MITNSITHFHMDSDLNLFLISILFCWFFSVLRIWIEWIFAFDIAEYLSHITYNMILFPDKVPVETTKIGPDNSLKKLRGAQGDPGN